MSICEICQKSEQIGFNRPNSQHRTKRIIKPNLQKVNNKKICTRCLRTLNKKQILV